jgi:hypothetical protein
MMTLWDIFYKYFAFFAIFLQILCKWGNWGLGRLHGHLWIVWLLSGRSGSVTQSPSWTWTQLYLPVMKEVRPTTLHCSIGSGSSVGSLANSHHSPLCKAAGSTVASGREPRSSLALPLNVCVTLTSHLPPCSMLCLLPSETLAFRVAMTWKYSKKAAGRQLVCINSY